MADLKTMDDLNVPRIEALVVIHPADYDETKHRLPIAKTDFEAGNLVIVQWQLPEYHMDIQDGKLIVIVDNPNQYYVSLWNNRKQILPGGGEIYIQPPPRGMVTENVKQGDGVRIAVTMHDNVVTGILVSVK